MNYVLTVKMIEKVSLFLTKYFKIILVDQIRRLVHHPENMKIKDIYIKIIII